MASDTAVAGTQVYKASGGRKAVLTVIVLLLSPFFISMVPMVIWRLSHGLVGDAAYLAVIAVIYGLCLAFLVSMLVFSYRSRVQVGDNSVKLELPKWSSPTPGFKYVKTEVPYDKIDRIETRGEIYRTLGVPSLLRATTLVTKDGERLHLGYSHETNQDPALPVGDIASAIAKRAGIKVKEKAGIKLDTRNRVISRKAPAWDDSPELTDEHRKIAADEYDKLINTNHKMMFYLAFVVYGLAGIAFFVELGKSGMLNPG